MYQVTKTYGHELGLSACFRQWRADSHCRFLHGYALSFTLTFEAGTLDERNWVIDFGGLKKVKQMLQYTFDHRLVVAEDDPKLNVIIDLAKHDLAEPLILDAVGCEKFAEYVWFRTTEVLANDGKLRDGAVRLVSVECREHAGNSATYLG